MKTHTATRILSLSGNEACVQTSNFSGAEETASEEYPEAQTTM